MAPIPDFASPEGRPRKSPKTKPLPPVGELEWMFSLDHLTGVLTWRNPVTGRGCKAKPGEAVGYTNKQGYLTCRINGRYFSVHRIVFKMVHGRDPAMQIDHRDGNRSNNRPDNLREATIEQNNQNRRLPSIGCKGVYRCLVAGNIYYRAVVVANNKRHELGVHRTPVEAARAYNDAATRLHGEFAVLNDLEMVAQIPRHLFPDRCRIIDASSCDAIQPVGTRDIYDI